MSEDLLFNDLLDKLREIHTAFPDLRFGQVLQTAVDEATKGKNVDLHDISTKKLLSALESHRMKIANKRKKSQKIMK